MKNNRLVYVFITIIVLWLIFITTSLNSQKQIRDNDQINEFTVSGFSTDLTKIVDDSKSSIVTIDADGSISTGFVYAQVENKIYVVSTYHGVETKENINVLFDSAYETKGEVIGFDTYSDIAIIEVESDYQINPLHLGNSSMLKDGEFVVNIGTPYSLEYKDSVQLGMISNHLVCIENSIVVDSMPHTYSMNVIEFSSSLKQGYSGSPLINMAGEAVGVCLMNEKNDICFAIPINEVKIIADKIIANEEYQKPILGIYGYYIEDLKNYEKSYLNLGVDVIDGLYVKKVTDNSISYLAGVKSGDVIIQINGVVIKNNDDYLKVLYGNEIQFGFVVVRDGQQIELIGNTND